MDIHTGSYNLTNLDKINIILGKNGCGKSTLLRKTEEYLINRQDEWGKSKYITPERGGSLVYEDGVEQTSMRDNTWLSSTRRVNQFTQFRQQSIAQYRRLKDIILEELERATQANIQPLPPSFDQYITRLNQLLDNIEIRRVGTLDQKDSMFTINSKRDGSQIAPGNISSGEAELISLGIECLVFEKECIPNKNNLLLLDEPDVHLHPDLQVRLMEFLSQLVAGTGFSVIISTHSTAILGALENTTNCKIGFMQTGDTDIEFKSISNIYKKILPVFGAHPLSNIFNQSPVLLVEGEDDERIWQSVVRSSQGRIKIYPCVTESITHMSEYETEVKQIIKAVYDESKAFSLRDRDDSTDSIDDFPPIIRFRLGCRNAENLILSNEVLTGLGTQWTEVKSKIDAWLSGDLNSTHPYHQVLHDFQTQGYDRKKVNIKPARNILMGQIIGSDKPWEVAVGQAIARLVWGSSTNFTEEGSLYDYLGEKLIKSLIPKS